MKLLKSGELSEREIQKMVIAWADLQPELKGRVIHIPNEGKRSIVGGFLAKKEGLRPGVSDLLIPIARGGYIGMWIELKSKSGKVSDVQRSFMADMETLGYMTTVCRSFDRAVHVISSYMRQKPTITK